MSEIFTADFKAWSCDMSLEIIRPQAKTERVLAEMKETLEVYERDFSRFQSESLISRLNAGETVELTQTFETLITQASELTHLTEGHFNAHVDLRSVGYQNSFEDQAFTPAQAVERPLAFPQGLLIEGSQGRLKPGQAIDFGGFLKGYLSQVFAEKYRHCGQGIIVNLGGDLTVQGQDLDTETFEIGVFNPVMQTDIPVSLQHQSLSTSGTYKRHWELEGETFHHILEPSTLRNPNTELVSASVWGPEGAVCDALATTLLTLPASETQVFMTPFTDYHFLTIDQLGQINRSS